jgi:hypothetical protein
MSKYNKIQPKPIGIILPVKHREIPESWMPSNDFSSHRPMLYRAITNLPHTSFFEFGMGYGSTPLLKAHYLKTPGNEFYSLENNREWFDRFINYKHVNNTYRPNAFIDRCHEIILTDKLLQWEVFTDSIVFIDCAPADLRKHLIIKHADAAKAIIVHDTEPGADYVCDVQTALNKFLFRCDLTVEGLPQTTIVSNLYDFEDWPERITETMEFV